MDAELLEFSRILSSINDVNEKYFIDHIEKTTIEQIPKNFWILSRLIRLVPSALIKKNISRIKKIVFKHRNEMLSAQFVLSHLVKRGEEIASTEIHEIVKNMIFPENSLYHSYIYNIISRPSHSNLLNINWELLQSGNFVIQKNAASAIASSCKNPANFLRRVLGTLCKSKEVENIEVKNPSGTFKLGLILIAECMSDNRVKASEYIDALIPLVIRKPLSIIEKSESYEAQKLLMRVIQNSPVSFHTRNRVQIFNSVIVQLDCDNLFDEYVFAILRAFGLFSIRKLFTPLIPKLLSTSDSKVIKYLKIFSTYSYLFPMDLQMEIHKWLIIKCRKNVFDINLYKLTAFYMINSSPVMSPFFPEFSTLYKNSSFASEINSIVSSLELTKTTPIIHPLKVDMKIPEAKFVDNFAQTQNKNRNVIIQCDRRDIRKRHKEKEHPAEINTLNINYPSTQRSNIKITKREDINIDNCSDVDIDM